MKEIKLHITITVSVYFCLTALQINQIRYTG